MGCSFRWFFIQVVFLWMTGFNHALASDNSFALLVANADYQYADTLKNTISDVNDLGKTFKELGFNVKVKSNLNKDDFVTAISSSLAQVGQNDTFIFYYAGHAAQLDGVNYLLPVDALFNSAKDIEEKGFDIRSLFEKLNRIESKINIIILDSCRNNPFSKMDVKVLQDKLNGYRALIRKQNQNDGAHDVGLSTMDAPINTLIAYSTKPGFVALDGDGHNSPYASALIKVLSKDGLHISQVFADVRKEVYKDTEGQQMPWESSSLTESFIFRKQRRLYISPF